MIKLEPKYQNLHCKICNGETDILGLKDFNRSCEEESGRTVFKPLGHAIYYHQCKHCGFIFSIDFDHWNKDEFLTNIYNDEYIMVDPNYEKNRPLDCVKWFSPMLGGDQSITIFDYGAGTDAFSKELKQQGYDAVGWDPLWQTDLPFDSNKKFDVVTAFEVLEHTPTPWETLEELVSFVNPKSGQIVISTLINDIIGKQGVEYWYLSPRNGHVCMHSSKSLSIMFDKIGMEIQHFSPSQHVASWK